MTDSKASEAAERAAYRRELRGIARAPRMVGMLFVFASLGLWAWPQSGGPMVIGPLSNAISLRAAMFIVGVLCFLIPVVASLPRMTVPAPVPARGEAA